MPESVRGFDQRWPCAAVGLYIWGWVTNLEKALSELKVPPMYPAERLSHITVPVPSNILAVCKLPVKRECPRERTLLGFAEPEHVACIVIAAQAYALQFLLRILAVMHAHCGTRKVVLTS